MGDPISANRADKVSTGGKTATQTIPIDQALIAQSVSQRRISRTISPALGIGSDCQRTRIDGEIGADIGQVVVAGCHQRALGDPISAYRADKPCAGGKTATQTIPIDQTLTAQSVSQCRISRTIDPALGIGSDCQRTCIHGELAVNKLELITLLRSKCALSNADGVNASAASRRSQRGQRRRTRYRSGSIIAIYEPCELVGKSRIGLAIYPALRISLYRQYRRNTVSKHITFRGQRRERRTIGYIVALQVIGDPFGCVCRVIGKYAESPFACQVKCVEPGIVQEATSFCANIDGPARARGRQNCARLKRDVATSCRSCISNRDSLCRDTPKTNGSAGSRSQSCPIVQHDRHSAFTCIDCLAGRHRNFGHSAQAIGVHRYKVIAAAVGGERKITIVGNYGPIKQDRTTCAKAQITPIS